MYFLDNIRVLDYDGDVWVYDESTSYCSYIQAKSPSVATDAERLTLAAVLQWLRQPP